MASFPIKLQFFLTYGVLGSLGPLMTLILKQSKGFDARQISVTLALSSIGMLLSPAVMTFLADRDFDSRKILRFALATTAGALGLIYYLDDHAMVSATWVLYSIVFVPVLPLLDGYYFNLQRHHPESVPAEGGYQFVRVWGTIGFMVPSVALYLIIHFTGDVSNALWCAVAWCGLSIFGTFALAPCPVSGAGRVKAPTVEAIRTLFSRKTLPMCLALFFAYMSANAYYSWISVFLPEEVGIAPKWVAPILSLGVAIEIAYIFGLGPIRRLLRIRGILILGMGTMSLRLAALALFPNVATALLIQILHGLEILAIFVVPVIYLDRVAGDSFRNSIQGALTIVVSVPARLIGYLVAGEIAARYSTRHVIYFAAGLAAVGVLVVLLTFKAEPARDGETGDQGST